MQPAGNATDDAHLAVNAGFASVALGCGIQTGPAITWPAAWMT